MDLTARAVSFINFIRDAFLKDAVQLGNTSIADDNNILSDDDFALRFISNIRAIQTRENEISNENNDQLESISGPFKIENKIAELVWIRVEDPNGDEKRIAEQYIIELCAHLVNWLHTNKVAIEKKVNTFNLFSPHSVWRDAISDVIYADAHQRVALGKALEYLPIQVVLALGGGHYDAGEQRILQLWQTDKTSVEIQLRTAEKNLFQQFKKEVYNKYSEHPVSDASDAVIDSFYSERAIYLLQHYKALSKELLNNNAPLSFEYLFNDELDEISKNRELREKEFFLSNNDSDEGRITANNRMADGTIATKKGSFDPFGRAKDMKLFAVAFSGGGTRSATFNLGILQSLAKKGLISKIDYLSTVSGGGYIGSWLTTWIKREGSITKVADQLNPEKSPNPLGDEVRPIRWLRMFSNYLSPSKSSMSVDSWIVAVTWLRNCLLNQLIIFLMVLSTLLLVRSCFSYWNYNNFWLNPVVGKIVYIINCLFLLIIAYLIGISNRWYNIRHHVTPSYNKKIVIIIITVVILICYLTSATLFNQPDSLFFYKLNALRYAGAAALCTLLLIAMYGKYDKSIASFRKSKLGAWLKIFYTSFYSAIIALFSLAIGWQLLEVIKDIDFTRHSIIINQTTLAFAASVPIILLVFSITVVSWIVMMSKYLSNENRQWFGRTSALISRVALIWFVLNSVIFIVNRIVLIEKLLNFLSQPPALAGWLVSVIVTIKAAFSSKTPGKVESKDFKVIVLDILSKAAPYLYILTVLILTEWIVEQIVLYQIFPFYIETSNLKYLLLAAIFFIIGVFLFSMISVNGFSMQHLYRDKLVRAYLGATRRKLSRERTINSFTGFDMQDDEKLSNYTNAQGYYGPYPILNAAMNASQFSDLPRQDRKAESFIFSPLYCGFDFNNIQSSINTWYKSYNYGYRCTPQYAYPNDKGLGIGTVMTISGAATNPNQGYHSSPGAALLLTVFNLQIGWWMANPRKGKWQLPDPDLGLGYILNNLTKQNNTRDNFVYLSDGGHFDNMGLYELIRRQCSFIILSDCEQDEDFTCKGFANAIRRCRVDFGAEISIDIDDIVKRKKRLSKNHFAVGVIKYSGDEKPTGVLIYIKSSITGDEPVDLNEYASKNSTFPHQATANQFFDEEQFESYRRLGMHIADNAMSDPKLLAALGFKFE